MSDEQNPVMMVIKVWAALTWADGVISKPEAIAMQRLVGIANLDDADRQRALGFLENEVKLDTAGLEKLEAPAREGIYRAAVKLSAIDDDITDSEIDFLTKLRAGLGIDDATAEKIEDSVANGA